MDDEQAAWNELNRRYAAEDAERNLEPEHGPLHRPSEDHYDPAEDQIMEWIRGEPNNPERRGRAR